LSDIFNDQTTVENNQNQQIDPLAELVGEGKKFKTPADLAKGKLEADAFIEKLKKENEELRKLADRKDYAEELLAKLETKATAPNVSQPPNDNGTQKTDNQSALSEDAIQRLVEQKITQIEKTKTATQNITTANDLMVKEFGETAKTVLTTRAAELGLSVDRMKELAAESPVAFLALVKGSKTTGSQATVTSKVNTAGESFTNSSNERNKSYYDKLRVENRSLYLLPATQKQMMDDIQRLGDRFNQ
jgi:hypothetical protein